MDLTYLNEFVTIARLNSFSLASQELCISQSSLSKHIKSLENELGLILFDRTTRTVTLNNNGKVMLNYAQNICNLNKQMKMAAVDCLNKDNSTIRIASIPVMAQYNITKFISSFQNLHKDIDIIIDEQEACNINILLNNNEYDIAFQRYFNRDEDTLEFTPYLNDELVAVLPPGHYLCNENTIDLTKLANENFIFLNKDTLLYDICLKACNNCGFVPKIAYTSKRPENIIDLVKCNRGVSLLMDKHTKYFIDKDIVFLPLQQKINGTVYVTRLKKNSYSRASKLFWEFVMSTNH